MPTRDRGMYSVQSVIKAIDLLEALASEGDRPTAPVLMKRLGLTRNKLFRLLATLEEKGLVERDDEAGVYLLGVRAFAMAQHILQNANIIRLAHPVMEELAHKLDEAVYFTVMGNDDEVLFLDMVDCFHQVKTSSLLGKSLPFFTNAAGKVMKAVSSIDIFGRSARKRQIPDPRALRQELEEIRKRGVAVDVGGIGEGVCSVAVAIRDYAGKVVGALTLLAPAFRLMDRLDREVIPLMVESAERLSMKFGYSKAFA